MQEFLLQPVITLHFNKVPINQDSNSYNDRKMLCNLQNYLTKFNAWIHFSLRQVAEIL